MKMSILKLCPVLVAILLCWGCSTSAPKQTKKDLIIPDGKAAVVVGLPVSDTRSEHKLYLLKADLRQGHAEGQLSRYVRGQYSVLFLADGQYTLNNVLKVTRTSSHDGNSYHTTSSSESTPIGQRFSVDTNRDRVLYIGDFIREGDQGWMVDKSADANAFIEKNYTLAESDRLLTRLAHSPQTFIQE